MMLILKNKNEIPPSLIDKFNKLSEQWKKETRVLSSISDMYQKQSYLKVKALGPSIVPLMLDDMEKNHTFWFGLLRDWTGANPIKDQHAGIIQEMINDWINWAKENGYQW